MACHGRRCATGDFATAQKLDLKSQILTYSTLRGDLLFHQTAGVREAPKGIATSPPCTITARSLLHFCNEHSSSDVPCVLRAFCFALFPGAHQSFWPQDRSEMTFHHSRRVWDIAYARRRPRLPTARVSGSLFFHTNGGPRSDETQASGPRSRSITNQFPLKRSARRRHRTTVRDERAFRGTAFSRAGGC